MSVFDSMSTQLPAAARYVLDRPRDVALLSMREQARQAGVQPATMTRFARHLGMDGYERIRELYAATVRDGDLGFAGRADAHVASRKLKGDKALAAEILTLISKQTDRLAHADGLDRLVAWHLHYVLTLIGDRSILLDGIAGTGPDALANATPQDLLLVASVLPYTRLTVELAENAKERDIPMVAVTDSEVAPIAQIAGHVILVPTDIPPFFHAMSPAFVVAEVLGAIVAGRRCGDALAALRRTDQHLAALDTRLKPRPAKRTLTSA